MSHVALVISGLDRIGGAERQVMLLAKGLRRRDWRVSVVALSSVGSRAAAELNAAGVEFLCLEMRKGLADPRGWIRYNRWLNREKPQVVHTHLAHAAWLARWSRLRSQSFAGGSLRPRLMRPARNFCANAVSGRGCASWRSRPARTTSMSLSPHRRASALPKSRTCSRAIPRATCANSSRI